MSSAPGTACGIIEGVELGIITRRAAELCKLHDDVRHTFKEHTKSKYHQALWQQACALFHDRYDELAFPGGLSRQMHALACLDPNAIDDAVSFLEADPWFFRSGYIKVDLIRVLKHAPLSTEQESRLRDVVLARVRGADRREFRAYAQLSCRLLLPVFEDAVAELAASEDSGVRRRARWVLHAWNLRQRAR